MAISGYLRAAAKRVDGPTINHGPLRESARGAESEA
jgi:hypothetical protein